MEEWWGRRRRGRSRIIRLRKSLVLYKPFNTLWSDRVEGFWQWVFVSSGDGMEAPILFIPPHWGRDVAASKVS
jgi:hypothetical protein